jgi:Lhr-like helicase
MPRESGACGNPVARGRLERARLRPLGFVANEYALAVWGLGDPAFAIRNGELSLARLFDQDMLGDDLEAWLAESALMKRTFRQCNGHTLTTSILTPGVETITYSNGDVEHRICHRSRVYIKLDAD